MPNQWLFPLFNIYLLPSALAQIFGSLHWACNFMRDINIFKARNIRMNTTLSHSTLSPELWKRKKRREKSLCTGQLYRKSKRISAEQLRSNSTVQHQHRHANGKKASLSRYINVYHKYISIESVCTFKFSDGSHRVHKFEHIRLVFVDFLLNSSKNVANYVYTLGFR